MSQHIDPTPKQTSLDSLSASVSSLNDSLRTATVLSEITGSAPTEETAYTFSEPASNFMFIALIGAWATISYPTAYLVIPSAYWACNNTDVLEMRLNNNISQYPYFSFTYRTNNGYKVKCSNTACKLRVVGIGRISN